MLFLGLLCSVYVFLLTDRVSVTVCEYEAAVDAGLCSISSEDIGVLQD